MDAGQKKIIDKVIKKHKAAGNAVVGVLQDIQEKQGYLSEDAVRYVSERLKIPSSQAFAVVTFYSAFRLTPPGRNRIQVCTGTACHIKGAENIVACITRQLDIKPDGTTADRQFSMHKVRCLGCCALAPVVKVQENIHADMLQEQVPHMLEKYR